MMIVLITINYASYFVESVESSIRIGHGIYSKALEDRTHFRISLLSCNFRFVLTVTIPALEIGLT